MSKTKEIDFIGTCSNCHERADVIRKRGVQLCEVCISKLNTFGNMNAFQYDGKAKSIRKKGVV